MIRDIDREFTKTPQEAALELTGRLYPEHALMFGSVAVAETDTLAFEEKPGWRDRKGQWKKQPELPEAPETSSELSDGEAKAINRYTDGGYEVNNKIRQADGDLGQLDAADREQVEAMDSAIEKGVALGPRKWPAKLGGWTLPDHELHRGAMVPEDSELAQLKPGDTFTDKAFTSTSDDPGDATMFMNGWSTPGTGPDRGTPVRITIEVPGDSKVKFYDGTKLFDRDPRLERVGVRELILPRGSTFDVVDVGTRTLSDRAGGGSFRTVRLRLRG